MECTITGNKIQWLGLTVKFLNNKEVFDFALLYRRYFVFFFLQNISVDIFH